MDNDENDFPLVCRPSSAVEKAAPGAQRILSGMVADTLALIKKSPPRIVLVDNEEWFLEMVEMMILRRFKNVALQKFQDSQEGWRELERAAPNLLICGVIMPGIDGGEIIRRLVEKRANYPILMNSGYPPAEKWVREYTDKNSNITFLRRPFTEEQLYHEISKHLGSSSNIQLTPQSTTPPRNRARRIVVLDENPFPVELMELAIGKWFKYVVPHIFRNRAEGLKKLNSLDPDLLILEIVNDNRFDFTTLQLLADEKAAYPIVVTSGLEEPRQNVEAYTAQGLNITFLPKPFTLEAFLTVLEARLKISRDVV